MASLTGPLMPRPSQPAERTDEHLWPGGSEGEKTGCQAGQEISCDCNRFSSADTIAKPACTKFHKEEIASDMPSIIPSVKAGAPIEIRKSGKMAVAISWPASLKKLDNAMPKILRLSQRAFSGASPLVRPFTLFLAVFMAIFTPGSGTRFLLSCIQKLYSMQPLVVFSQQ